MGKKKGEVENLLRVLRKLLEKSDMNPVIISITQSNFEAIPEKCRSCLYWSFPEETEKLNSKISATNQKLIEKKKQSLLHTLQEFGNCAKILYYNDVPVGYAEYGPSHRFPQIKEYKSQPIGQIDEGVVFLSCLYIVDETLRRKGLGEKLLDNVIADLKGRGFTAIETYAREGSTNNPSGPIELYRKKGFYVKDDANPEFPIARLDL